MQSQQNDTSDESEEEEDDLITLSGCDITTQWRFPEEMKCCPEPHCWAEFGVRSDAIRHYKKRHANHSIVCPACVMPIMCTNGSLSDFRTHYNHIHPNDVLPYGLDADVKPQVSQFIVVLSNISIFGAFDQGELSSLRLQSVYL